MSQEAVEKILGRAITDARFRQRARQSFVQCCTDEGYAISLVEAEYLARFDLELLESVSMKLDAAIRRS